MNQSMLHDVRLRLKVKGLLFILAVCFHGRFTLEDVAKKVSNRKLTVKMCMRKLIKYGYVIKTGNNKLEVPVQYLIFEK